MAVKGDIVSEITGQFLGSGRIGEPYGLTTCNSFRDEIKSDAGSSEATEVKLVVTFKGVFLLVNDASQELLISANIKDVTYIWGDAEHDDEMVFVTHQTTPTLIECHFIRVTSTLVVTAADDFVGTIDRAAQGKYPGSLGVWDVNYNGSVAVEEPKGNHVVKAANKRIKTLGDEARAVALVVCETEMKVVDKDTAEEIKVFPIMDVSFTALDPKDSKKFSFITNDTQFGLLYCHSFGISAADSQIIPQTIADSFGKVTAKFNAATPEERRALQLSNKGTSGALGVFDAKYIGSVPCKQHRGNDVIEMALKDALSKKINAEVVVIIVSPDGVRTIEGLTSQVKQSIFIEHVTFTTTLGEKKEIFGFISQDTRLKRILCHLYECGPGTAFNVTKTIGEAFSILSTKTQERKQNAFASVFTERDPVPGQLFRCQVHRKDVVPDKVIGAGQFGQVYLAMYKSTTKVAVKTVRLAASENDKDDFVGEAEVMRKLVHPSLVQLIGVAVQQRPWLCVIEYVQYGDLADVLQSCKEKGFVLTYLEQHKLCVQVVSGLAFIASKRFLHMDIAARNCLVGANNVVKVADFGLTTRLDRGRNTYTLKKTAKLPVRWLAIEAIETGIFSEASDVWAFGVLIWEVLTYGELPFKDVMNAHVQKHVIGGGRLVCPSSNDAEIALTAVAQMCWITPMGDRANFVAVAGSLAELKAAAVASSGPERDVGKAASG